MKMELQIKILNNHVALQNEIIKDMLDMMKRKCVRGPDYERTIETAEGSLKRWAGKQEA